MKCAWKVRIEVGNEAIIHEMTLDGAEGLADVNWRKRVP